MTKPIATTVSVRTARDKAHAFATAIPADLTKVLLPKGPLPGVRDVTERKGDWTAPGHSRRVVMSDGASLLETLTAYEENTAVAYRIEGFKAPLGLLVTHAEGAWSFDEVGPAETKIAWTFTFYPRSAFTAPIVGFIARRLWPGYAGDALDRVKAMAESDEAA